MTEHQKRFIQQNLFLEIHDSCANMWPFSIVAVYLPTRLNQGLGYSGNILLMNN